MLPLQSSKKILVLAAHPDDETLGCGGSICRLVRENHDVQLITFTDGVSSREGNQVSRSTKLQKVCGMLGISRYVAGDFPDNALDSVTLLEICKFIEANVAFTPDIVFTHFPGDLNIDHQLITKAALTAFRPQYGLKMKIYSYYVPSATDYGIAEPFDGNSYMILEREDVDRKLQVLKCYDEEMRTYPHSRSYENVENLMKVWGAEIGAQYCEKFKLIREVA